MSHSGYARVAAIDRFEDVRRRSQIHRLWEMFRKKRQTLLPFAPIHKKLSYPNGVYQGVQDIPVQQIVGSLAKAADFDRDFRPLHKSQRERWVNIWWLHAQKGWEPILVHKLGNYCFVEDGHHRTSVARDLGLEKIEAVVIDYPVSLALNPGDSLEDILASLGTVRRQN